jgi:hypothetical protein
VKDIVVVKEGRYRNIHESRIVKRRSGAVFGELVLFGNVMLRRKYFVKESI